jgi:hypothetical protein
MTTDNAIENAVALVLQKYNPTNDPSDTVICAVGRFLVLGGAVTVRAQDLGTLECASIATQGDTLYVKATMYVPRMRSSAYTEATGMPLPPGVSPTIYGLRDVWLAASDKEHALKLLRVLADAASCINAASRESERKTGDKMSE